MEEFDWSFIINRRETKSFGLHSNLKRLFMPLCFGFFSHTIPSNVKEHWHGEGHEGKSAWRRKLCQRHKHISMIIVCARKQTQRHKLWCKKPTMCCQTKRKSARTQCVRNEQTGVKVPCYWLESRRESICSLSDPLTHKRAGEGEGEHEGWQHCGPGGGWKAVFRTSVDTNKRQQPPLGRNEAAVHLC